MGFRLSKIYTRTGDKGETGSATAAAYPRTTHAWRRLARWIR